MEELRYLKKILKAEPDKIIAGTPIFDRFLTEEMKAEIDFNAGISGKRDYLPTRTKEWAEHPTTLTLENCLFELGYFLTDSPILEVGSGPGWLATRLAKLSRRVVAVDVSYPSMKILKKLAKMDGVRLDTCVVPVQNLEDMFKERSFDFVFASATLHHCPDLDEAFRNIHAVLNDGGAFLIFAEAMAGKLWKNREIIEAQSAGLQDVQYTIRDYLKAGERYFHMAPIISHCLMFNRHPSLKTIPLSWLAKSSMVRNNLMVRKAYFGMAYLLGRLPVDFVCVRR